ncbi:OLC1v1016467C1 [Oldenlandia corymbosa var. corymbosa]|uniref:OLC1v1016467C1 n=1 Tax=Oldenlandia corymbosa var. corymbosa TaxID=529605 RepID=A0AAV1E7H7_OLDCO|nr:OLC1v1016467C1 [Oldenlandia corymbosa var. corymbosa]
MEAKALAIPSESSDAEGCLEDLNNDENSYAFGCRSNLQCRKVASTGRWIDDLGMAELVVRKGNTWNSTGIIHNGKVMCFIEEILFLAEIGAFEILNDDNTLLSMREIYESTHINKMFTGKQRKEVQPIFDVYNPSSKFKKSSPGHPSFVLCLARGQPPSKQEVEDLEKRCGGCPLKFCKVDVGRTSFFSIDRVEFPVLP